MIPSLFIAHGAPLLAIENNEYTRFISELGRGMPRPKAIVLFSAHWESEIQQVSDVDTYSMIYDFGGFPDALYNIVYSARGAADVSASVASLLQAHGVAYQRNETRGLDHGAWVVLRLLFPDADIPVVTMSVNPNATAKENYRVGQALEALRADDVLIVGSGGTVHNLRRLSQGGPAVDWAIAFDDWLKQRIETWDVETLLQYANQAPQASLAVPAGGNEHFIPLLYAMGAADKAKVARRLFQSYEYGSLSHAVWQFG